MQQLILESLDDEHANIIREVLDATTLSYRLEKGRFTVDIDEPMDAYFLGANVAAAGMKWFEGPLITQKKKR